MSAFESEDIDNFRDRLECAAKELNELFNCPFYRVSFQSGECRKLPGFSCDYMLVKTNDGEELAYFERPAADSWENFVPLKDAIIDALKGHGCWLLFERENTAIFV